MIDRIILVLAMIALAYYSIIGLARFLFWIEPAMVQLFGVGPLSFEYLTI